MLRLSLDEFSLPKFYQLFGISRVHSAASTAFRSAHRAAGERYLAVDRSFSLSTNDKEKLSLSSLEAITDALLEIMESCAASLTDCNWLRTWTELTKKHAFNYNPALQPRGIIVFGCISKTVTDWEIKQLLRILVKALESFSDITLIDAIIMCLTRLQPLLRPESPIHKALFWVAVSVLQLDEISLYASGLALLEQNLHTLDCQNTFDTQSLDSIMLATRDPLEWHLKPLDHSVGLSFRANFHFALVGHLIKGYRHPSQATVTRTTRILSMLLSIVAKPHGRDKFEVTPHNVAYLAALVSVSEEVKLRCHVKHQIGEPVAAADSPMLDNFTVDHHLGRMMTLSGASSPVGAGPPPVNAQVRSDLPANQTRQMSLEVMDPTARESAQRLVRSPVSGGSLKLKERTMSLPTRPSSRAGVRSEGGDIDSAFGSCESSQAGQPANAVANDHPMAAAAGHPPERASVSNDNNILLDPDVLTDHVTQVSLAQITLPFRNISLRLILSPGSRADCHGNSCQIHNR